MIFLKKLLFFLFFSVITITSFISIGYSTNYVYYQNTLQSEEYLIEDESISYYGQEAYRIAQVNFNYPSDMNFTDKYPTYLTPNNFNCIVKDFTDIDFNTGNKYPSKYLDVNSLISSSGQNYIRSYRYNEDFYHYGLKFRFMVLPTLTFDSITIRYYNEDNSQYTEYLFRIDLNYIDIRLVNGTSYRISTNPFPSFMSYDVIAIDVIQNFVALDYTEVIHFTAFKLIDGSIVGENSILTSIFKDHSEYVYNRVDFNYTGDCAIICEDINLPMSLSTEQIKPQRIDHLDYIKYEDFYLNKPVNIDFNEFNSTALLNSDYYYTNELFWGRYLKYQLNSYNVSGNNIFIDTINSQMRNSFSFNHEIELKENYNYTLNISFIDSLSNLQLKMSLNYGTNPNFVNIKFYNQSSLITSFSNTFYEIYEIGHLNIQFKSNILSIAIKNKFECYTINYFVPYFYQNCSSNNLFLGNYKLDFLTNEFMFNYQNGTNFAFKIFEFENIDDYMYNTDDYFQIVHNLFEITEYIRINEIIELKTFEVPLTIYDIKGNSLYLVSNHINQIVINFTRNIDDGFIKLNDINRKIYYIFDNNDGILNKSRNLDVLGYEGGGSISFDLSYEALSEDLLLYVDIYYYVTTIYSTENPNENLLTKLALNIMVPFFILGVIVFGMKSNSNSKYLGFVGMFIGVFVLYLMEYMSIYFMIISEIVLGVGLYFIIKSEQRSEI